MSKPHVVVDVECYRNFFLVMFKRVSDGRTLWFQAYPGSPLDVEAVRRRLSQICAVTFNGNRYDMPMLALAMTGASCERLKEASDAIITEDLRPWDFEDRFDCRIDRSLDHIDLIEVAPGQASLKIYGGRLHAPKMQDLPIEPDADIWPDEREYLREYCENDLDTTIQLFNYLRPQIDLREKMSEQYAMDLRSKSDAQIAEAVIKDAMTRRLGHKIERPDVVPGTVFKYDPPLSVQFRSMTLENVLSMVRNAEFTISEGGKVQMPEMLENTLIPIGKGSYRMGIGGLHSSESSVSYEADRWYGLEDRDVTSYYPSMIIDLGLYPEHLGPRFTDVYKKIVADRVLAKHVGDKVTADTLKIVCNGSFGKFGSKWSALCAHKLLIQTTVTGQLYLLMLIEMLCDEGFEVVSANTDGIVIRFPLTRTDEMGRVIARWEYTTGLTTEGTRYKALYSRDVNNYLAIKEDGTVKAKGAYAAPGLQKNPTNVICVEAVTAYLLGGTLISQTIESCTDLRKFLTVRRVNGGAVKDGIYLGKAVRWYYANGISGTINYKTNGNTVARSEGAKPCMNLPLQLPPDVNYAWYIDEAYRILNDIGYKHPKVED